MTLFPNLRPYPPTPLAKYPHLNIFDKRIWSRFIIINPLDFKTIYYDVRVGTGANIPNPTDNKYIKDFNGLTQKRIDVVALAPSAIYIIEVKPLASIIACGQAIIYRDLFKRTYHLTKPLKAAILTDDPDPDIQACAIDFDVHILTA